MNPHEAYGELFAVVYDKYWSGFATYIGGKVARMYQQTAAGESRLPIVDLCCGTGQAAKSFRKLGFEVTAVDLSPHMLRRAEMNLRSVDGEMAFHTVLADASTWRAAPGTFGAVVCLHDSMNHLPDFDTVDRVLQGVAVALRPGGLFVFDVTTLVGLQRMTDSSSYSHDDCAFTLTRFFDVFQTRGLVSWRGFLAQGDGTFRRFENYIQNLYYDRPRLLSALERHGFTDVRICAAEDLTKPAADPEALEKQFFVCTRR